MLLCLLLAGPLVQMLPIDTLVFRPEPMNPVDGFVDDL